jgi:hypothetical protein
MSLCSVALTSISAWFVMGFRLVSGPQTRLINEVILRKWLYGQILKNIIAQ